MVTTYQHSLLLITVQTQQEHLLILRHVSLFSLSVQRCFITLNYCWLCFEEPGQLSLLNIHPSYCVWWCPASRTDPNCAQLVQDLLPSREGSSASLQSYVSDVTAGCRHQTRFPRCSRKQVSRWTGGGQRPPSLDEGLSERPSFPAADDFFCFCLDFLSIRTCTQFIRDQYHCCDRRRTRKHITSESPSRRQPCGTLTFGPAAEMMMCPGGWIHGSPSTWTGMGLLTVSRM